MPRGLAAALEAMAFLARAGEAAFRTSAPPTSTSWPRRRQLVDGGLREAALHARCTPGREVRGQKEPGKCSVCQAGASIASCRFMPAMDVAQEQSAGCHWSCWSPPGDPQAMYGSPSRWASVGVERGARPLAGRQRRPDGLPRASTIWPRDADRRSRAPGMTGEAVQPAAGRRRRDHVAVLRSTMSKCTVSPLIWRHAADRRLADAARRHRGAPPSALAAGGSTPP